MIEPVNTPTDALDGGCAAGESLVSDVPGWTAKCGLDPVEVVVIAGLPGTLEQVAAFFAFCEHHWGELAEELGDRLGTAMLVPKERWN